MEISDRLQSLLADVPIRWVQVSKIHLTLKFLGEVSETNAETIAMILKSEASNQPLFEFSVGGLGVFPNLRRPRVIWVGVEDSEDLLSLQHRIEMETARLGYAPDKHPFSPHLTLGRLARNASGKDVRALSEVMRKEKLGFVGVARVREIHLISSELKRGGAVYTKLLTAPLGGE